MWLERTEWCMWCSRRKGTRALVLLTGGLLALPGLGCVERSLLGMPQPFEYEPLAVEPPPGAEQGSIWPGDYPSGSFLFFDRKARGVGDLVTVQIVEDLSALGSATTDVESTSKLEATLSSDIGFVELLAKPVRRFIRALTNEQPGAGVTVGQELTAIEAETENTFEGEGTTERKGSFRGVVTCRVIQVLPGNIFHIRGRRALVVNHEVQYITVEGLVRREDIRIDNTVLSSFLADAQLSFDGLGVVDDKQRPGWVLRVFSWLYPY